MILPIALMGQFFTRPELDSDVRATLASESAFERGQIQHLVILKFDQDTIHAKRGEKVTIPFTLDHKSHSYWQWITVGDFQQSVKNYVRGKYVDVSITEFSPTSVVVLPNSSTKVLMTFVIDPAAPDEIVGKSVTLGVQFDAEVALGGSYTGQAGSITILVDG